MGYSRDCFYHFKAQYEQYWDRFKDGQLQETPFVETYEPCESSSNPTNGSGPTGVGTTRSHKGVEGEWQIGFTGGVR
jgi:hypothetical protein